MEIFRVEVLMVTRRSFILKIFKSVLLFIFPYFFITSSRGENLKIFKTQKPAKGLVLWYSQTGHTERIGRIIAAQWRKQGLNVHETDIESLDFSSMGNYDVIAAGVPVFYFDIPVNVKNRFQMIPDLEGIAVASFVTYGGTGHNQHNTGCDVLELFQKHGGVPVCMKTFGNMSTFAPTWSAGNSERILRYSHLPDKKTYQDARDFGDTVLHFTGKGKVWEIDRECSFWSPMRMFNAAWWTALLIGRHEVNHQKCISCGTCTERCPGGAINSTDFKIDKKKCIACMGCINNCPVQAIEMEYMGNRVYGFFEFMKREKIAIGEPEEVAEKMNN